MLKSILYDYIDAYILFEGIVIVSGTSVAAAAANNENKKLFQNYTSFINCTSKKTILK